MGAVGLRSLVSPEGGIGFGRQRGRLVNIPLNLCFSFAVGNWRSGGGGLYVGKGLNKISGL